MGLTLQSTSFGVLKEKFKVELESPDEIVIALAGNPNTGKSTVFNRLTGLNQHTGNWPGKTVTNAQGRFQHHEKNYILVDLPGTYSLFANSMEEQVARDFICFGNPEVTVVVADATSLERNLNLVIQILEITDKVVVCVNLLDEAKRKKITVDLKKLSDRIGVPVVGTSARSGKGLQELKDTVEKVASGRIVANPFKIHYETVIETAIEKIEPEIEDFVKNRFHKRWMALRLIDGDNAFQDSMNTYLDMDFSKNEVLQMKLKEARGMICKELNDLEELQDRIVSNIVSIAEDIRNEVVSSNKTARYKKERDIDGILTSRLYGIPIMIALLGLIFWITIAGANIPSALLADGLFWVEGQLSAFFLWLGVPVWVHDMIVYGVYRTLAWVVSVMLPPMAIFFPLFTLLEDLGYLPRVAFNLDYYFKKACAHGKQALTMCMGFGCNAAGIISCRIIDSPRERLIAILTNNFVPCNGRFPTLIALSSLFIAGGFTGAFQSFAAAIAILAVIVSGVMITLLISRLLSKTVLKGMPSSFTLELPPYRRPQIGRIIVRSIIDRTLFVLGRAAAVAAPAGLIIWVMANISIGDESLMAHCAQFLDPFAKLLGLDGYILMAFLLGLPANEIVIPILIMSYLSGGSMLELDSLTELRQLFLDHGWTSLTAVCMMLFSLNHWPCATTLWTIRKETQSWKWTGAAFLIPTVTGIVLCFVVAQGAALFRLV